MPWKSRWQVDIPNVSLPTYVFKSPTAELPQKPLYLDADKPDRYWLSHDSCRSWCQRFAAGLIKAGLRPGDRVLLFSGNTLFFPVVILGIIMAGGVFTGANPSYVARELAYQLKDSGATFLITADGSLETSLEAAESIGFSKSKIFLFDNGYATFDGTGQGRKGCEHWSRLIASPTEGQKFVWEELTTPEELDRIITLNYSSGTTGVPKGVMITHRNYVSNTAQVIYCGSLAADYEDWLRRAKWLAMLPMYHAYGQTYFAVNCLVRGIATYIMQKFDFVKMLNHIQDYKITDLNLVPPIAVLLAKHASVKDYDLSSVTSAVGELNANVEAKIVDDNEQEVAQGQRGELWIRGPNVMKGYWQKPEATKETLTEDLWLKTGDISYLDKDGKLFVVDRKKELIKVKGNQVAPAELEALLLDHPAVADAAVIGVTIKGNELPRAYLVLKQGAQVGPADINKFMETRVSKHKRLAGGVVFIDAIPKNPSGKILRKTLREQAKAEVGDSDARQSRL
ncbi:hypothetical protein MBLNU459_g0388t3 [Dothideomycetes sp. NU459]